MATRRSSRANVRKRVSSLASTCAVRDMDGGEGGLGLRTVLQRPPVGPLGKVRKDVCSLASTAPGHLNSQRSTQRWFSGWHCPVFYIQHLEKPKEQANLAFFRWQTAVRQRHRRRSVLLGRHSLYARRACYGRAAVRPHQSLSAQRPQAVRRDLIVPAGPLLHQPPVPSADCRVHTAIR